MVIIPQISLCEPNSHMVASAEGEYNEKEMREAAAKLATDMGVERQSIQIIPLDAAKREWRGKYLIVVTKPD